jgi:hypothetical protein
MEETSKIFATLGARRQMRSLSISPEILLIRHIGCDWTELSAEELQKNTDAFPQRGEIRSRLSFSDVVFIVTTEAGWSRTVIRLAHEDFSF